jgi:polar amino acid transport system substrate-binding protein
MSKFLMKMKRVVILFSVLSLFLWVHLVHSSTLRVGISTAYPPVAFKNEGKISGIEAELAAQIEQLTDMTIQFVEIPWNDLEDALNQGKIDVVMSGVSVTEERKKRVAFTQPYMTVGQMVLIKADNIMSLSSKTAMYSANKRFGAEYNTTGQQFVEKEFAMSQIMIFKSVKQGITALKLGKIDYFVHDAPTIWQYTVLPNTQDNSLFGLYEYMTEEPLAWVVKKGNTRLLQQLNQVLVLMQEQGLVTRSINKWIPSKIEVGKKY